MRITITSASASMSCIVCDRERIFHLREPVEFESEAADDREDAMNAIRSDINEQIEESQTWLFGYCKDHGKFAFEDEQAMCNDD